MIWLGWKLQLDKFQGFNAFPAKGCTLGMFRIRLFGQIILSISLSVALVARELTIFFYYPTHLGNTGSGHAHFL